MWKVIQNHSFKHQLIRDILTAIGTIVIFVWTIFSYKLYKQIFLINILAASVWKLWPVWFNFGSFQHISALKSIKYPIEHLKVLKQYRVSCIVQPDISAHWANGTWNGVISIGQWGVFNHEKGAIWQSHLAAQKEGVVTAIIFSNHKTS